MSEQTNQSGEAETADSASDNQSSSNDKKKPKEIGGRKGPEPTRYGDWEKNGLISDF